MISLIVARADNGVIGKDGHIPWRIADDMRRFKALTLGKPCIMGRATWDSLPKKPLPDRPNIVVTRNSDFRADGAQVAKSLADAVVAGGDATEIMIIGGAEIYRAALTSASKIYLTEVHLALDGDTFMAPFESSEWQEVLREERATPDGLHYSYVDLQRI